MLVNPCCKAINCTANSLYALCIVGYRCVEWMVCVCIGLCGRGLPIGFIVFGSSYFVSWSLFMYFYSLTCLYSLVLRFWFFLFCRLFKGFG